MKSFLLHIGAGKTGTSAIQSQLVVNREKLADKGWYYPESITDEKALNYRITSGNAIEFGKLLRKEDYSDKKVKKSIHEIIKNARGNNILLSSELMETYDEEIMRIVKSRVLDYGYELEIVYYVRAIADHLVSMYHQLVNRHLYTASLKDMLDIYYRQKLPYKFVRIIEKSEAIVGRERLIVKNYDRVKDRIVEDFLEDVLGIEDITPFTIEKKKINRSLTRYELSLMRYINRFLERNGHSAFVSDALVQNRPNLSYNMGIEKSDAQKLEKKYAEDVVWLENYLKEEEKPLKVVEELEFIEKERDLEFNSFQESVLSIIAELVKEVKRR